MLSWIESSFYVYRIDFDDVSKRLQFVSSRLVSKRLCIEMTELIPRAFLLFQVPCRQRNFSGLFRMPQFPLYLRNAEDLTHQSSRFSWFFLH